MKIFAAPLSGVLRHLLITGQCISLVGLRPEMFDSGRLFRFYFVYSALHSLRLGTPMSCSLRSKCVLKYILHM